MRLAKGTLSVAVIKTLHVAKLSLRSLVLLPTAEKPQVL